MTSTAAWEGVGGAEVGWAYAETENKRHNKAGKIFCIIVFI
jgi:hypothetical protein